ncbi:MAG: hypothetical protein ABW171_02600, partial [Steroidobacter sp.]
MIFNSFIFWAFFAVVLLLYWRLPLRGQNQLLLVASYIFYGYWDWRYLFLLAASTIVDYYIGYYLERIEDEHKRKQLITVSVVMNLTFLGFFKYFGFFVDSFAQLLQALGFEPNLPVLHIVLPVGLSFYTFQSMAYTIDIYRRAAKPAQSLFNFAVYVSYFPQLVAGPIERPQNMLHQFYERHRFELRRVHHPEESLTELILDDVVVLRLHGEEFDRLRDAMDIV